MCFFYWRDAPKNIYNYLCIYSTKITRIIINKQRYKKEKKIVDFSFLPSTLIKQKCKRKKENHSKSVRNTFLCHFLDISEREESHYFRLIQLLDGLTYSHFEFRCENYT